MNCGRHSWHKLASNGMIPLNKSGLIKLQEAISGPATVFSSTRDYLSLLNDFCHVQIFYKKKQSTNKLGLRSNSLESLKTSFQRRASNSETNRLERNYFKTKPLSLECRQKFTTAAKFCLGKTVLEQKVANT